MLLLIEIGESDYETIKNDGVQSHIALADEIIANGTPIKEGDAISREALKNDFVKDCEYCAMSCFSKVCEDCYITEAKQKIDNAPSL